MKFSYIISLILAFVIAILSYFIISLSTDYQIITVSFIIFVLAFICIYLVIGFAYHHDFYYLEKLIEELHKISRVENVSNNRKKLRLLALKKIYNKIYSNSLKRQHKIDELNRIAAFRKEFIADVSHELKTPIFAAQGFVHTLIDGADEDENVRKRFLKKAAQSLDGLDLLIHDLLTLSHIEIGETKMQFEYFDIQLLTIEVIEQLESRKENRNITIFPTSSKPIIVYADWLRIKQVLTNLISNALKYSKDDGSVEIILQEEKNSVEIAIKDDGVGIPERSIHRIFERFYRVDKSRSRGKGGTGLGLAIVKHIVEGHHSKVGVKSTVGKGSIFTFSLPKGKK